MSGEQVSKQAKYGISYDNTIFHTVVKKQLKEALEPLVSCSVLV